MKQTEEIREKIDELFCSISLGIRVSHDGVEGHQMLTEAASKQAIIDLLSSQLQAEKIDAYKKGYIAGGLAQSRGEFLYELQGVVEDAVHCGAQAATGDFKKLESEET